MQHNPAIVALVTRLRSKAVFAASRLTAAIISGVRVRTPIGHNGTQRGPSANTGSPEAGAGQRMPGAGLARTRSSADQMRW
jgi:hypothetical protein